MLNFRTLLIEKCKITSSFIGVQSYHLVLEVLSQFDPINTKGTAVNLYLVFGCHFGSWCVQIRGVRVPLGQRIALFQRIPLNPS